MDFTTVEENLRERGFKVCAFATAQEAADLALTTRSTAIGTCPTA